MTELKIGPFTKMQFLWWLEEWCKQNPIPEPFDDNDSWHYAILEMHDHLNTIKTGQHVHEYRPVDLMGQRVGFCVCGEYFKFGNDEG